MFKKVSVVLVIFFLAAVVSLVAGFMWYKDALRAVSTDNSATRFVIPKGATATEIAQDLKAEGLIKSAFAFKLYTQLTGVTGGIFAGEFTLAKNLTLPELVDKLRQGPSEIWVTIPEGLRREQYPKRFIDTLGLTGLAASDFADGFINLTQNLEGRLFPDTYLFPKDVNAEAVVARLTSTFSNRFSYKSGNLSESDAIVLASIIERETLSSEERPVVAGILLNRLDADWPIQADATVQYALGTLRCETKIDCDWWDTPLKADLEIASPYNTYKIAGLPPTPIANPGLTSLQAVISPTSTDYMFYIHDGDGVIHYAKTLEEHNQNIAEYLR